MTEPIGDVFCKGDVTIGSGCMRCGRCAVGLAKQQASAVATLKRLGYTDCGGELWKPPLGLLHKPRREVFDGSRKVMKPSADLPEPAWRAETIRTTEDAYSAEQMRQQFDAGRTFQASRNAAAPSDHQCKLLADALGECIMAAGIVRKDIDGLSGPQLLMFAEDLKRHLAAPAQEDAERYRILRNNPRIAHRFAGLHACQRDQYVDAVRAAAEGGAA